MQLIMVSNLHQRVGVASISLPSGKVYTVRFLDDMLATCVWYAVVCDCDT
jgi:hypothetical protein